MKAYLVTGGAGFIGSNIVKELVHRGEKVRVLDNFSTGHGQNLAGVEDEIQVIEGDIRSYHIVRQAMEGINYVLHQAALPSVPRSIVDPITSDEVNTLGTLNVLDAARDARVTRIVNASSSSVYGDNPRLPKTEEMMPNPLSPYAVSKLAAENYCRVFYRIYGLSTVTLRYFNVFGPGQDPKSQYSAVIPKFIRSMQRGIRPVVFGDGSQSRDFTFVQNVVDANLAVCDAAESVLGKSFNCATSCRVTLNELVSKLNVLLGNRLEPVYEKQRLGDIQHSYASIELAKEQFNYDPRIDFDEGLKRTVESFS